MSSKLEDGGSYYGLWHLLTRVKWLYRTGEADAGVALALDALPRIERMADRNLLERMMLLAAEGLGRVGRHAEGAALMAHAVRANPDPPLEMLAEAERIAGRLAAADSHEAAHAHFGRAGRIVQAIGNLTAVTEIARDAAETMRRPADEAADRHPPDPRPPAAPLAERIAALLDLAAHPPLLASETLGLLADTGAALGGAVVEIHGEGRRQHVQGFGDAAHDRPGAVRMAIGAHRGRDYEVVVIPRESPSARATVLAVERLVQTALALADWRQQERERTALWPEPTPEQQLGLICAAESMLDLVKTTRRVAATNVTVLISGETGTGKELFARALHQASARRDQAFIPFNCTAVPRDMLDSQLFGYRRGAFTGAHADFAGVIRTAAGGTLFLDEIGELSPDAQPKLLRFLESGEILPLGDSRPHTVDVRIVAATNADLDHLVDQGAFRQDLYYRLNVIHLRIPPLRERREEIPLLVEHFLERHAREMDKPMVRVSDDALEYLVLYRWPGNVRQLANELRRVVAMSEPDAVLMPEHLSPEIFGSRRSVPASERALAPTEMIVRTDQPLAAAIEHVERAFIHKAMRESDGNQQDAARALGLSRRGLYQKRMRYGFN